MDWADTVEIIDDWTEVAYTAKHAPSEPSEPRGRPCAWCRSMCHPDSMITSVYPNYRLLDLRFCRHECLCKSKDSSRMQAWIVHRVQLARSSDIQAPTQTTQDSDDVVLVSTQ